MAYLLAPDCPFHLKVYVPAVIVPVGLNPLGVETEEHAGVGVGVGGLLQQSLCPLVLKQ